jgi:sec-independent protein translocase protein TatC
MSLSPVVAAPPPPRPPEEEEDDDVGGKMSFLEHLDELRTRIIRSLLAVVVGFVISFAFIERIFRFIMEPLQAVLPDGGKLIYTEPAEAFILYMKVAALVGLIIALPALLWQAWSFVAPGLYANEKRLAIPFVVSGTVFFVCGALFSHYVVFPAAWVFFAGFSTDYMEFTPRIAPVFSLYVRMGLGLGAVFQIPTLVMFLARIGLVTPGMLARNLKYALLAVFVVAALITPGADPLSQVLVAVPMMGLYILSIGIAWVFRKRKVAEPTT